MYSANLFEIIDIIIINYAVFVEPTKARNLLPFMGYAANRQYEPSVLKYYS